MRTTLKSRVLHFAVLGLAAGGALISAKLLMDHDGGWAMGSGAGGFLWGLCELAGVPSVSCADVVASRWGSFDVVLAQRHLLVPTSFVGLAYFVGLLIWLAMVPAGGARWVSQVTLALVTGGLSVSIMLLVVMFVSLKHWCPLCLGAHVANGIIFLLCLARARGESASQCAINAWSDTRRWARAALTTYALVVILLFGYYDSSRAARRQFRKAMGFEAMVASIQRDADLMLREFNAQPVHGELLQDYVANGGEDVSLIAFETQGCSACRCFAKRWKSSFGEAFGRDACLQRWDTKTHADLAERLEVTSTPAVFLNGRRVPDLCLDSYVFWAAVGKEPAPAGGVADARVFPEAEGPP